MILSQSAINDVDDGEEAENDIRDGDESTGSDANATIPSKDTDNDDGGDGGYEDNIEGEGQQQIDEDDRQEERSENTEMNRLKMQIAELKFTLEDIDAKTEVAKRRIELLEQQDGNDDDSNDNGDVSKTGDRNVIERLMDRLRQGNDDLSQQLNTSTTELTQLQNASQTQLKTYLNQTTELKRSLQSQVAQLESELTLLSDQTQSSKSARDSAIRIGLRSVRRTESRRRAQVERSVRTEKGKLRMERWKLESRLQKVRVAIMRENGSLRGAERENERAEIERSLGELEGVIGDKEREVQEIVEMLEDELMKEEEEGKEENIQGRGRTVGLVKRLRSRVRRWEDEGERQIEIIRVKKGDEMVRVRKIKDEERRDIEKQRDEKLVEIDETLEDDIKSEKRKYDGLVLDFERRMADEKDDARNGIDGMIKKMRGNLEIIMVNARKEKNDMINNKNTEISGLEKESAEDYAELVTKMTEKISRADGDIKDLQGIIVESDRIIEVYEAERKSLRKLVGLAFVKTLQRPRMFIKNRRKRKIRG